MEDLKNNNLAEKKCSYIMEWREYFGMEKILIITNLKMTI